MAKILLIEDETILRENTCELLEAYGFECVTAENGSAGLVAAQTEKFDLIVCDIMLPYLNGYEIKAKLNSFNQYAQIPFIFLSAKAERDDLRLGMDLGAADYITKPFKIVELVNSIYSRLEQSKTIRTVVEAKVIESINDFIHLAKHECNTPLHGIINLSDILASDVNTQPDFSEKAIKAINISGKRLYKTLNNLIDLVRLRHYTVTEDRTNKHIDIISSINAALTERSLHYGYKGKITKAINCLHQICILQEDLDIILFELIDNMFKFSASGDIQVDLNTLSENGNLLVSLGFTNTVSNPTSFNIHDIGPFKQYNRGQIEQQGSGLGLYLVKLITDNHSGSMEIDNSKGSVFRIKLTIPVPCFC